MNLLAAALADRYRIERELGQGGMATVYLARDIKHDPCPQLENGAVEERAMSIAASTCT